MTSNINPNNIDGNYPVAGQDNNSQGFRDNFSNIKNNLTYAKSELEDLQNKVLLKSALVGSTLNNNLAYEKLTKAQLKSYAETFYDLGSVSDTITLNYDNGNCQKFTSSDPVTIEFSNWPAGGILGRMVVYMNITNIASTVTLPTTVSVDSGSVVGLDTSNNRITFSATGEYAFEFTSYEGQNRFKIVDLSRNRDTVTGPFLVDGPMILANPTVPASSSATGTAGQISWDSDYVYICVANNTWKRIALTSF